MKRFAFSGFALALSLASVAAAPAGAITATFDNQAVSAGAFSEITAPAGVPAAGIPAPVAFIPNASGSLGIPSGNAAIWVRYDFMLPAGFDPASVAMEVGIRVDNEAQMFLNGMSAAIEDDTVVGNFSSTISFMLNDDDSLTNTTGNWDALTASQSMFQTGLNTVHFFATNNGGPGFFILDVGTVDFELGGTPSVSEAPLAATLAMGLAGLVGLAALRRRR